MLTSVQLQARLDRTDAVLRDENAALLLPTLVHMRATFAATVERGAPSALQTLPAILGPGAWDFAALAVLRALDQLILSRLEAGELVE